MYASVESNVVLRTLESSREGISVADVARRTAIYGENVLPEHKHSRFALFLSQFNDVMVFILFGALAISIVMPFFEQGSLHIENFIDAMVITFILLLNAALGFVQEFKAEEAIELLRKLSSPQSRVRREGRQMIIHSQYLVPGDIVIVEAGDRISADGRILSCSFLSINESSLTGESSPVEKSTDPVSGDRLPLSEQRSMVFSGTLVTKGFAEFVVTETGLNSEIGKIAKMVSQTKFPETPLQERMRALGKFLGAAVLLLCVIIVGIGVLKQLPFAQILLISVSLAVSAVPEGLPAVVTVCLAMGVRRMARKKTIVRRLESLETLGSVTVICADKTGTITQNNMSVVDSWLSEGEKISTLAVIAASCNHAQLPDVGDPTEIGLLRFARDREAERLPIDEEIVPFTSENKYMQTRHVDKGSVDRIFLKGAPESIAKLSGGDCTEMLQQDAAFARRGLRVLACAQQSEGGVRIVGLIAMEDPPRPNVSEAIALAKTAGIRTIMITGDNLITASAIADQVGILGKSMHGSEIDQLTPEQLAVALKDTSIFARVSPQHKLKILDALRDSGEIVAMSGDGVNDAPALKGAHVGVAMGLSGTEVAREAASIVLADDDYATIVQAIREGRRIYDNIRKFVLFLLRTNFDELLFISACMLLGLPLPYLALHILWINLMTDGLPALALGMEREEPDVMTRPPRDPNEHILAGESGRLMFAAVTGFSMSFILYLYLLSEGRPLVEARSVCMTLAILFELFVVISLRSSKPIWRIGFFSNRWMLIAIAIPFALQFVILFTPMSTIFRLTPISLKEWIMVFCISFGGFLLFEMIKLLPQVKR